MSAAAPFADALRAVADGRSLDGEETQAAFSAIVEGRVDEIRLGAFLTALKVRGETVAELTGAVRAVRGRMTPLDDVPEGTVDVCGTGGDGLGTLNVSTAVAFVLAGLGVPVAKHGNRALSSKAGATDVLEALGIPQDGDPRRLAARLRADGLVFLAAPLHHAALRHAAHVRKVLGFRTLFNLLGPLCNPARVRRQLVGVYESRWCEPAVRALAALGATDVWAVHGTTDEGGSDELTLAGPAEVCALADGEVTRFTFDPALSGLPAAPIAAIRGGDAAHNAAALAALLDGARGPYRDTVLLNAAAALHVAGRGAVLRDGALDPEAFRANIAQAARSIDAGHARRALERARECTPESRPPASASASALPIAAGPPS